MMNSHPSPSEAKQELAKRELARRRLIEFNKYVYRDYQTSWHIEALCNALDLVIAGKIRFLMVEMPPRHSKSINVSQLFPAFAVGLNKDDSVIVSSYSGDLATDHGRETRNLIDSQEYQNLFDTKLAADSNAKGKWNTDGRGAYNAAGVGGSITGKGAKYFVIDDPFKDRKEADSFLIREDRFKWLRSVARTRLTPDGAMIITHTRWHDDDIIGRLTDPKSEYYETWIDYFDFLEGKGNGEKWVRLCLPAVAEIDEPKRKAGDALWPTRYNLTELADIKNSIGSYEWSALYQQNPVDIQSRDFKPAWFRPREWSDVVQLTTRRFLTIDPRGKDDVNEGKDSIGLTRNYVDMQGKWNLRSERKKINTTELIDTMFRWHSEDHYEKIGIEDTQFYQGMKALLAEEMQKRGIYLPIVELKHTTQKELRILGLVPRYEFNGIYHIYINGSNQCSDLEEELLRFPKAVNDDSSDSAAMQSEIAEQAFPEPTGEEFGLYGTTYA